jgi:hypothetical protein
MYSVVNRDKITYCVGWCHTKHMDKFSLVLFFYMHYYKDA